MKKLLLLIILVSLNACAQKFKKVKEVPNSVTYTTEKQMAENVIISYQEQSRAYTKAIDYTGKELLITISGIKKPKTIKLSKEQISTIDNFISELEPRKFSEYTIPSKKHWVDAAPAAFLKIKENKQTYSTANFDHGTPPKEISRVVNLLIKLSELK